MPLPEQAFVPNDRKTTAPYNFVPLPEDVFTVAKDTLPGFDVYDSRRHTGVIQLSITTNTLLYTRCAYPPRHEYQKVYRCPERQDFFHHGNPDQPFLPGSSIRGMLLSLMEILTYSKINRVNENERLMYRAVGETTALGTLYKNQMFGTGASPIPYPLDRLKGGYLKFLNGCPYIQPAVSHHGESFVHTTTFPAFALGRPTQAPPPYGPSDIIKVWLIPPRNRTTLPARPHGRPAISIAQVLPASLSNSPSCPTSGTGWVRGTLVKSGDSPRKHRHCIIYEGDPNQANWKVIDRTLWETYREDCRISRGIPNREIHDGDPLFYLVDASGNPVFFGPTQLFRLAYRSDTGSMIPQSLKTLDENDVDMAEAVYGSTRRKGRLRFMDAELRKIPEDGNVFVDGYHGNGRIVPKILSGPKVTSFQNYLVQPHQNVPMDTLRHYDNPIAPNADGTVIRGHKEYWNKSGDENQVKETTDVVQMDENGLQCFRNPDQNTWRNADDHEPQHTVIRPVKPGCMFSGKICFENLDNLELGALLTTLALEGGNSRHRLGMGKPYGMGRIRIEYSVELDDRTARYASMDSQGKKPEAEVSRILETCREEFSRCIILHHQERCGGQTVRSIWEIPRIKDLALLMKQPGPSSSDTAYVPIPDEKWRKRHVLPSPRQIAGMLTPPVGTTFQPPKPSHAVSNSSYAKGAKSGPFNPSGKSKQNVPKTETRLLCVVLEKKTNKNKWKFKVKADHREGILRDKTPIPPDIAPGKEYLLTVFSANPNSMIFEWKA